jgi:hypothetical protein
LEPSFSLISVPSGFDTANERTAKNEDSLAEGGGFEPSTLHFAHASRFHADFLCPEKSSRVEI